MSRTGCQGSQVLMAGGGAGFDGGWRRQRRQRVLETGRGQVGSMYVL